MATILFRGRLQFGGSIELRRKAYHLCQVFSFFIQAPVLLTQPVDGAGQLVDLGQAFVQQELQPLAIGLLGS